MGEGDQNPNILRNFSLSKIRFKKKFLKEFQKYKGGVKALWTFSKQNVIFFRRCALKVIADAQTEAGGGEVVVGLGAAAAAGWSSSSK